VSVKAVNRQPYFAKILNVLRFDKLQTQCSARLMEYGFEDGFNLAEGANFIAKLAQFLLLITTGAIVLRMGLHNFRHGFVLAFRG
jgi:hypothetical protein